MAVILNSPENPFYNSPNVETTSSCGGDTKSSFDEQSDNSTNNSMTTVSTENVAQASITLQSMNSVDIEYVQIIYVNEEEYDTAQSILSCSQSMNSVEDFIQTVFIDPKNRDNNLKKCKGTIKLDNRFLCNICNRLFTRYSSLWSHRQLHSGLKPFKCQVCGSSFAKNSYLKNHEKLHTGQRPFKCEFCEMCFSQSPHLRNHERIHTGEKPYQCLICEKKFARHSTLWNHKRIHTGERPYGCKICGAAFNQASHLKNHWKVHSLVKPYRCEICEYRFSNKFALSKHRKMHEKYAKQDIPNQ